MKNQKKDKIDIALASIVAAGFLIFTGICFNYKYPAETTINVANLEHYEFPWVLFFWIYVSPFIFALIFILFALIYVLEKREEEKSLQ